MFITSVWWRIYIDHFFCCSNRFICSCIFVKSIFSSSSGLHSPMLLLCLSSRHLLVCIRLCFGIRLRSAFARRSRFQHLAQLQLNLRLHPQLYDATHLNTRKVDSPRLVELQQTYWSIQHRTSTRLLLIGLGFLDTKPLIYESSDLLVSDSP